MTDETTATAVEDAAGGPATDAAAPESAAGDRAVEAAGDAGTPPVPAGPAAEEPMPADGWVQRYLVPLLLPVAVVAGLVFYVLNVSRIFLASAGAGAVVIAVTITVSILVGATLLSAAPRMRTSSIALIVLGAMLLVLAGGSLTVGHAEEHEEEELTYPAVEQIPEDVQFTVESFNLGFDPNQFEVPTGFFAVTLSNREVGQHNFTIETQGMDQQSIPEVSGAGEVSTTPVFVGEAGDYVFFCSVPGHRQAGMEGTITAVGDPITRDAALAALGGAAPAEPAA